jgi:hypothetical protein
MSKIYIPVFSCQKGQIRIWYNYARSGSDLAKKARAYLGHAFNFWQTRCKVWYLYGTV